MSGRRKSELGIKLWLIFPSLVGLILLTNSFTSNLPEPFIHKAYAEELPIAQPQPILETQNLNLGSNCYAWLATQVKLPRMVQIQPNTTPHVGAVAIFYYNNVKHVALITELKADGFTVKEANFHAGKIGTRFVEWGNYALAGFYEPESS